MSLHAPLFGRTAGAGGTVTSRNLLLGRQHALKTSRNRSLRVAALFGRKPAPSGQVRQPCLDEEVTITITMCRYVQTPLTPLHTSQAKPCKACKSKGSITCPGCKVRMPTAKPRQPPRQAITCGCWPGCLCVPTQGVSACMQGTGKDKKNGNVFERWKWVPCCPCFLVYERL